MQSILSLRCMYTCGRLQVHSSSTWAGPEQREMGSLQRQVAFFDKGSIGEINFRINEVQFEKHSLVGCFSHQCSVVLQTGTCLWMLYDVNWHQGAHSGQHPLNGVVFTPHVHYLYVIWANVSMKWKHPHVAPPASHWGTKLLKQLWPWPCDLDLRPWPLWPWPSWPWPGHWYASQILGP